MRQPFFYAALLVLAGVLMGISECPLILKSAFFALALFSFFFSLPKFRSPLFLLISLLCFSAGFLRALPVSAAYREPETAAFFSELEASNPGQFDYALYLKSQGIRNENEYESYLEEKEEAQGAGTVQDAKIARPENASLRTCCIDAIEASFSETDAGLYRAILLGDRSETDESIRDLYQASGISHLLAVSGLHIGIFGMGITGILKKLRFRKLSRLLITAVLLTAYVLLCGAVVSAVRAAVMFLLSLAAEGTNRRYSMRSAVAVSLICILLYRPYQVFSGGFQLSFGAVAAISVTGELLIRSAERYRASLHASGNPFRRRIPKRDRLPMPLRTFFMSLAVQLTLLPVMAWHYFTFAPYGILLNLVVIPLMAGVVWSGLAAVMLSGLFYPLLHSERLSAVHAALRLLTAASGAPGHYILAFYEKLCLAANQLPFSEVCIGRPELLQILVYYAGLLLLCAAGSGYFSRGRVSSALRSFIVSRFFRGGLFRLLCREFTAGRKLTGCRKPQKRIRLLLPAGFLFLLILNTRILLPAADSSFRVTALDVGQGDGFIIRESGRTLLIDGGSTSNKNLGERVLQPFLLSEGITEIDRAIVSHADFDHYSGILYLLTESETVRIGELVLPQAAASDPDYEELIRAAEAAGSSIHVLSDGEVLQLSEDCELRCIYAGSPESSGDGNRESSVLLLSKGSGFSMLFTGDSSSEDDEVILENWRHWRRETRYTVLKAAHHGSSTGSSALFLDTIRPDYVLLSYKKNNRYGHPAKEVTDRMEARRLPMLRTAESGAVTFKAEQQELKITEYRKNRQG